MEQRPRVLAIDDDPDFREGLTDALDALGYPVTAAASGREALDVLRTEPLPDVILLDLRMPDMDGREFREAQRGDSALSQIPCVVVSGSREVEELGRSLGAAAVLAKPFRIQTLVDSIERITRN
jgi:CheY-like chemotaxis protein